MRWGIQSLCTRSGSHDQDDHNAYIWEKNFGSLLRTERPMTLKLGMQHWLLGLYQVCPNDDAWLTLTYRVKVKLGQLDIYMGKRLNSGFF